MIESEENLHFLDYWRIIRSRKEIVITVFLLVVVIGIIVTITSPKTYMASTKIMVKEESPDIDVYQRENIRFDPFYLRTQFEIIQSRTVMDEVIKRMNLVEKLGKAYGFYNAPNNLDKAYKFLKQSMKVHQYRDTHLIEIQIYLSQPLESAPELAAEVANQIAHVFTEQRQEVNRKRIERALDAVLYALDEQKEKLSEREKTVEEIRQKYKINIVSSAMGTDSALAKTSLSLLETERIKARMELADQKVRYDKIRSLPSDKLLDAAPYIVGDSALASLVAQKRSSEVELSRLKEAYGLKHPDVVRADAVIKELDVKISEALDGLKTGVQTSYEAAKQKSEILAEELETLKAAERTAESGKYREFDKAVEELERAKTRRELLENQYNEEKTQLRIPSTIIEVIEEARAPALEDNVSPNVLLNIFLSIILGITSGIGLAFFAEYLDTSVKTIEEIERFIGVSVLGVIPQKVKPLISPDAQPAHAETYRVLRSNLQFSKKLGDGKTICITSGSMAEGKSLTLFNLAYIYAQLGDKVLIVDSDLHRPKQHKMMNTSNKIGLTNILIGDVEPEDAIVATNVPNLDFLPSGKLQGGAHGLLDSEQMQHLISVFKENYDYIFFDSPPVIGISDASQLARKVDGVLLVIQHRKYPKAVSGRAKDILNNIGANLIGVVLNNINISRDYSYYYYHYASYYPDQKKSHKL